MKKKTAIILSGVIVLMILFVPLHGRTLRDGGTREYNALTYKLVRWNKIGSAGSYKKTSIYWLSDSRKSLDELWETER